MFAGGILGWFVLIPAIVTFGTDIVMYPATVSVAELYATGGASAIWASYIKYIGAGAVAAAGIISLIKTFPTIVKAFTGSVKGISKSNGNKAKTDRTNMDIDMRFVLISIAVLILLIWMIVGAILVVIFGFFFSAVSSRMVGLVGSSNNPVSGMTIATVLIATFCLKLTGDTGVHGMQGAIAIGSIICIAACMAGDTSQDLKTGYILGATPKKQQIGEIMGTIAAALAIGGVMVLLDSAFGFGTDKLAAPQATMMKMIIEGVMDGNLPWTLIFIGVFIAIVIELLGISALPVAIGLYLPLELSAPIMLGGLIKFIVEKVYGKQNDESGKGILFCSGLIAGEGILGIVLAILTVAGVTYRKHNITDRPCSHWCSRLLYGRRRKEDIREKEECEIRKTFSIMFSSARKALSSIVQMKAKSPLIWRTRALRIRSRRCFLKDLKCRISGLKEWAALSSCA